MANRMDLAILKLAPKAWNAWRQKFGFWAGRGADFGGINLGGGDLRGADLGGINLGGANLYRANLYRANLGGANLGWADLRGASLDRADFRGANLSGADLRGASLDRADLNEASLYRADLRGANLSGADLSGANLSGADLNGAILYGTILADLDLSSCKDLDSCVHHGPSTIDHGTLQRSGPLPLAFLRGVGLPDNLIDYLPSLLGHAIQFYSCFISYSSKDQAFAERLHADLQAKGVRCWFAPHDMSIGAKILRDKVLLVLSEGTIASDWVEGEVTRALDEERERKKSLLFPIRLDDTVLETKEAWARLLRDQRNIGDFTRWKDHDAYSKGLERLLRDLKVEAAADRSAG